MYMDASKWSDKVQDTKIKVSLKTWFFPLWWCHPEVHRRFYKLDEVWGPWGLVDTKVVRHGQSFGKETGLGNPVGLPLVTPVGKCAGHKTGVHEGLWQALRKGKTA